MQGISGMISKNVTVKINSLKEVVRSRGILSQVMLTYGGFCPRGYCPGDYVLIPADLLYGHVTRH